MSNAATDRPGFVTELFLKLGSLEYAIERGLEEIDTPLLSDLDVIIRQADANRFIETARKERLLIHAANTFGGSRVFIGRDIRDVKRIDFMWLCQYRGINLLDLEAALNNRKLDPVSGLYVLPEAAHARVLFAVKNAYGGAEKYRSELSSHGFSVLEPTARRKWLAMRFLLHPVRACIGAACVALTYATRLIKPTGLVVFGKSAKALRESNVLGYIFQNRVRHCSCLTVPYLSRLGSALCVVTTPGCAQLDLSSCRSIVECERVIVAALRARCRSGG